MTTSNCELSFRGMPVSNAVVARAIKRVERLERYCGTIIACRVGVEMPHHHHAKGHSYRVTVSLKIPGEEIIVSKGSQTKREYENVFNALRDAFNATERQLQQSVKKKPIRLERETVWAFDVAHAIPA